MKGKVFNYTVIFQKEPKGGYTVIVPALAGCVTYGKSLDEAKKMAVEAIELYIESLDKHHEDVPEEKETFYTQIKVTPTFHHA
ncbi:MAG: type II toxin-antitoxin system HicB family antitoxin [Candidatus Curtissbacteria bacterium]|nr:type II toxin-antitoxin system HicB family antitoxin [Candidatus Curtissbacteria bacterium]